MQKIKRFFSRLGQGLWRHKVLCILFVLALAGGGFWLWRQSSKPGLPAAGQTSYVRTTRLVKGNLSDSISASGTVTSNSLSNVATDLKYVVKEIHVKVGDTVREGDVICTLDTTELEKNIAKLKENLAEQKSEANDQVSAASDQVTKTTQSSVEAEAAVNSARAQMETLSAQISSATAQIAAYQSAYDSAEAQRLAAGESLNAVNARSDASEEEKQAAQQAYDAAQQAAQAAQQELQQAKDRCNYDGLQKQYQEAQQSYQQARQTLDQLEQKVVEARQQLESTKKTNAKAGTSDELEELESQLEKCTLRASASGKVTSIDATVGSMVNGSVATIQDTENLKLAINIPEYDIGSVKVGLPVKITSDATDGEIEGELTQISPVAGQNGFSAEVTIKGGSNGLYIGMNAKAEIILSTIENVFTVPIDAVEEQEDGTKVVYVKTGGSGADAVFEPVKVTTGAENDYYVEISGEGLSEGMEVRSSANPDEATSQTGEMIGMDGIFISGAEGGMGAAPSVDVTIGGGGGNGGPGGMGGGGAR